MTVYKNAKEVVAKHEGDTTSAEFIRTAPHGLYFLIREYRSFIKAADDYNTQMPYSLDAIQIAFLYQLYDDLYQFLNPRPLWGPKKNVITKSLRTKVDRLKSTFLLHKASTILETLPSKLHAAVCQLIDSTLEFVEAFGFLDSLIVSIKNRPTDWAVKKRVAAIFIRHQEQTNTKSFPKLPAALRALNRHKHQGTHQLSPRNYGNLKQQWRRGTYWHFIQP